MFSWGLCLRYSLRFAYHLSVSKLEKGGFVAHFLLLELDLLTFILRYLTTFSPCLRREPRSFQMLLWLEVSNIPDWCLSWRATITVSGPACRVSASMLEGHLQEISTLCHKMSNQCSNMPTTTSYRPCWVDSGNDGSKFEYKYPPQSLFVSILSSVITCSNLRFSFSAHNPVYKFSRLSFIENVLANNSWCLNGYQLCSGRAHGRRIEAALLSW